MKKNVPKNLNTVLNHTKHPELRNDNKPLLAPIYNSVKYTFDTYDKLEKLFTSSEKGYIYGRVFSPNVNTLSESLAKLQGCEAGIVLSSGCAALSTTMISLVEQGDHIICFMESYAATRFISTQLLKKFGVTTTLLNIDQLDDLEKHIIKGKTKFISFESPTNPQLKVADIELITRLCKKYDVLSIMDNTFAGVHNHIQFEIDIYIHSLTKFVGGHGDLVGGAILSSKKIIDMISANALALGANLDASSAQKFERSLKTYSLRYDRACENAAIIANRLSTNTMLDLVHYPGLKSHPQYDLAKKQQLDFGSLIFFNLKGGKQQFKQFLDALKLIKTTASLGSTESLIAPCELFYAKNLTTTQRQQALILPSSLRLSVGIEDINDIWADLEQAFAAISFV